jgi:hypothetical protein
MMKCCSAWYVRTFSSIEYVRSTNSLAWSTPRHSNYAEEGRFLTVMFLFASCACVVCKMYTMSLVTLALS